MQVIRFTGVTKSYGKGAPALKNVGFSLAKGEFAFLTGPSGAGKSTLLRLIYMGTRPTEGEVRVSGFSSSRIGRREIPRLRRRLGIIFQDFRLLKNRTARENVAFALEVTGASRTAIGPKVQRTLNAVGLARKVDRFPNELSGGEQQRVAIARALANDPFILLADEPTGNLDTKTSLEILRILRDINSLGMAVLLATHDYTLLAEFPEARVLHLVEGVLVSDTANPQLRPVAPEPGERPAAQRGHREARTAEPEGSAAPEAAPVTAGPEPAWSATAAPEVAPEPAWSETAAPEAGPVTTAPEPAPSETAAPEPSSAAPASAAASAGALMLAPPAETNGDSGSEPGEEPAGREVVGLPGRNRPERPAAKAGS